MKWLVLLIIILLVLIYIFIYNVINQNETKALFYPSKKKLWKPNVPYKHIYLNMRNENDICHDKRDKKRGEEYLSCWYLNNFKNSKTVCFFHGTTGNITHREYIISLCHKFRLNLFLFDYSGYGESCGFPHKQFLRDNAERVYSYLTKQIPEKDIIVWTESLGCLSGSYLCSKYNCGGLILMSGFSSLDDLFNYHFEGYKHTASKVLTTLLSYKMDYLPVKEYLKGVKCPVVVIHSKNDELIPYECANINYDSIRHDKKIKITIDGGHACPKIKTRQFRKVFKFFNLPEYILTSNSISYMLKELETFAERHNKFM